MIEENAKLHALAWRLIGHEGGDSPEPTRLVDAADNICRKLRERLADVIGDGGFSAILEHAMKLTRTRYPFLPVYVPAEDGTCLKGLEENAMGQDPGQLKEALMTLCANFLVSLVTLIGRDLSYTFLSAIWPAIEMEGLT